MAKRGRKPKNERKGYFYEEQEEAVKKYLEEYIEKEKRGEVTMEDAKRFLDKKYKMKESTNA